MTELPLKTDLVVWLPLAPMQKRLYEFLITKLKEGEEIGDKKYAFFLVTYFKKLCLHPQLLLNMTLGKKATLGMLSADEEVTYDLQREADA